MSELQREWERILTGHKLGMARGRSQLVYVGLLHRRYDSPGFCRELRRCRPLAEAFNYSLCWKPMRSLNLERTVAAQAADPELYREVNRRACEKYRKKKKAGQVSVARESDCWQSTRLELALWCQP